jgi:hypothetical protein
MCIIFLRKLDLTSLLLSTLMASEKENFKDDTRKKKPRALKGMFFMSNYKILHIVT